MVYKHRITQGLADLIGKYGGGGKDPMMRAIWFGLKSQVPMILQALDSSEEAIAEIEAKLKEVLDIKDTKGMEEELASYFRRWNKDGSTSIRIPADSKVATLFPLEPTAKVEITLEPVLELLCPLCGKPSIDGKEHKECMDREAMLADKAGPEEEDK